MGKHDDDTADTPDSIEARAEQAPLDQVPKKARAIDTLDLVNPSPDDPRPWEEEPDETSVLPSVKKSAPVGAISAAELFGDLDPTPPPAAVDHPIDAPIGAAIDLDVDGAISEMSAALDAIEETGTPQPVAVEPEDKESSDDEPALNEPKPESFGVDEATTKIKLPMPPLPLGRALTPFRTGQTPVPLPPLPRIGARRLKLDEAPTPAPAPGPKIILDPAQDPKPEPTQSMKAEAIEAGFEKLMTPIEPGGSIDVVFDSMFGDESLVEESFERVPNPFEDAPSTAVVPIPDIDELSKSIISGGEPSASLPGIMGGIPSINDPLSALDDLPDVQGMDRALDLSYAAPDSLVMAIHAVSTDPNQSGLASMASPMPSFTPPLRRMYGGEEDVHPDEMPMDSLVLAIESFMAPEEVAAFKERRYEPPPETEQAQADEPSAAVAPLEEKVELSEALEELGVALEEPDFDSIDMTVDEIEEEAVGASVADLGDGLLIEVADPIQVELRSPSGPPPPAVETVEPKTVSKSSGPGPLVIAFGGGKGGSGRSMLVANVGVFLAHQGRRVVVADLAPSGANLHTYLGLDPILPAPGALLRSAGPPVIEGMTGMDLRLCRPARPICIGGDDPLRARAFETALKMDAEVIVLDLGGQGDALTLDTFNSVDIGVVVVLPEPVAVERTYAFLRAALFRKLLHGDDEAAVVARALLAADQVGQLDTPEALAEALAGVHPSAAESIRERVRTFTPRILMNRCRARPDRQIGPGIVSALERRWGVHATSLGAIEHDDTAIEASRRRRPLMIEYPGSTLGSGIERLARRLLSASVREARI